MTEPSHIGLWAGRYVRFLSRRAGTVLLGAFGTLVLSLTLASRLELHTNFSELLPSNDPGVVALHRTQQRMGDLSLLLIGIRSPDREANLRYAEALTTRLRALPPEVCKLATYHVRDIRDFFERNKWLYLSEDDLTAIRDRLRHEITKRKNPLLVDLGGDDESLEDLRRRVSTKAGLEGRFPGGVFGNADGTYVWIAALPPGGIFSDRTGEELYRTAHDLIATLDPAGYHPQMRTHVLGPVASAVATRHAVERDIMSVTITCVIIVALSIALYFRRARAVPLIGLPAVVGTVMAFAVAELAFGYLNSSSAFLGSIILGNGINYAIILMSRYYEERALGRPPLLALEGALAGVVRGTAVAAVCASGAYASLMLTSFRGFFQFGLTGAVGVIFCWLATFTILPAMFVVLDRHRPAEQARRMPTGLAALGRLVDRRSPVFLGAAVVVTILSARGLVYFAEAPFEYDFRRLNARLPTTQETRDFDHSHERLFGRWPQPTIILADHIDEVRSIKQAIRRQDAANPGPDVMGQIFTIYDVLPGTPEEQKRKLALVADLRKLTKDPALEVLGEKERKDLARIDPPADLRVLGPEDLPPLARRPFTEADGTVGRVVLAYFVEKGISVWNGRDLLNIAGVIQNIHLENERKTIETSGNAVVFSAMLRSILRDGPRATVASLLVVFALSLIIMRPMRSGVLAMLSLLCGVVWMVGAAGWAEVKITFLNFIALPITFGIGAEYALNVVARYKQDGDMVRAVASTGSAVALCSWTTIVGYGSLLAAQNRALQGFGAMAILGEIACLLAAVVALPSAVLWRARRRRDSRAAMSSEPQTPAPTAAAEGS